MGIKVTEIKKEARIGTANHTGKSAVSLKGSNKVLQPGLRELFEFRASMKLLSDFIEKSPIKHKMKKISKSGSVPQPAPA